MIGIVDGGWLLSVFLLQIEWKMKEYKKNETLKNSLFVEDV